MAKYRAPAEDRLGAFPFSLSLTTFDFAVITRVVNDKLPSHTSTSLAVSATIAHIPLLCGSMPEVLELTMEDDA